jgi:beta-glucosidase
VEHLSDIERVLKALDAGVVQFGGENCPNHVVELVENGRLTEERIDQSVRRLLKQKFELGLFETPLWMNLASRKCLATLTLLLRASIRSDGR